MKTAAFHQDPEGTDYGSRVVQYRSGLDLTVEWHPGAASETREELTAAYHELMASIVDEKG